MIVQNARRKSSLVLFIECLLPAVAVVVCWRDVSWAFRPGLSLMMDEVANLARFLGGSWWDVVNPVPHWIYNERPAGFALERLLFDIFGLDYSRQVIWFVAVHFANCALAFLLFRRLRLGIPLCLAAIGVYASLSTTAQTATYIGAAFDVLCLFFILFTELATLSVKPWACWLSGLTLLMALCSKEFAIVVPLLSAVLVIWQSGVSSARTLLLSLLRRLWLQFGVAFAFTLRWLFLLPRFRAQVSAEDPYHMHFHIGTLLASFAYYTSLVVGLEESVWARRGLAVGLILAATLAYALIRRRGQLIFAVTAWVLTLLPLH
jgi:hypothetical protein